MSVLPKQEEILGLRTLDPMLLALMHARPVFCEQIDVSATEVVK